MNRKSSPNQPRPHGGDEQLGVQPRELMLYLDGELDDAQRADVEAKLAVDRDARCHVAGMQLTGALLRERAATSPAFAAGDSIADLVMARIDKGHLPESNPDLDTAPAPVAAIAEGANGVAAGAQPDRHLGREALSSSPAGSRPSHVAPKSLPHIGIPPSKRTANDNARTIWALTAVAVAAAAAFMVWGKTEDTTVADPRRPSTTQSLPADPPAEVLGQQLPPDAPRTPDTDVAGGVEVATVDFGQTQGSVFYVPGSGGETTTVVWLADTEAGGEQ